MKYSINFVQPEIYKVVQQMINEYVYKYGSADRMAQALQLKKLLQGQDTISYTIDEIVNTACEKIGIMNNSHYAFLIIGL